MSTPEETPEYGFGLAWKQLRAVANHTAGQFLLNEPPTLTDDEKARLLMDLVTMGDIYIEQAIEQAKELRTLRAERETASKLTHKHIAKLIKAHAPYIDRATARSIASEILES